VGIVVERKATIMTGRQVAIGTSMLLIGFAMSAWRDTAEPAGRTTAAGTEVNPATMTRVGTVDERYQSYNVEMLEVTGGKFCEKRVHLTGPNLNWARMTTCRPCRANRSALATSH